MEKRPLTGAGLYSAAPASFRVRRGATPILQPCGRHITGRRPSDQGANRRRTARTRQREHGNPSTKQTRRTRNANPPSSAHNRNSTGQPTNDTLTRIVPEQQRQHQQTSRRQLKRDARASDNNDRSRQGHDRKQPKHEARTRTMSSHDGNIQTSRHFGTLARAHGRSYEFPTGRRPASTDFLRKSQRKPANTGETADADAPRFRGFSPVFAGLRKTPTNRGEGFKLAWLSRFLHFCGHFAVIQTIPVPGLYAGVRCGVGVVSSVRLWPSGSSVLRRDRRCSQADA
jgi:hypothetical protein